MRRAVLAIGIALLAGACGGGGGSADQVSGSSAAPGASAAGTSGSNPLGCDFAKNFPTPAPATGGSSVLTKDFVDRTVAATPSEIRDDVRLIMQTALDIQAKAKEIERLPNDQKMQRAGELLAPMQKPEYTLASQRINQYMKDHCPGYAGMMSPGAK